MNRLTIAGYSLLPSLFIFLPLYHAPAAGSGWVPAEMAGRILMVNATVNGKGPVRMLLDTGATENILTWGAATRLGLARVNAGGVSAPMPVRTLSVGAAAVTNPFVVFMDPPQALTLRLDKGVDYNGLLGYPFLKNFRITLDYRGKRVCLEYPAAPLTRGNPRLPELGGGWNVSLQLHDRYLYAPVKINGQGPLSFLVDSGSSEVLLMPRAAVNLGLRELHAGNSPGLKWTRLESVSIGNAVVSNVIAAVYDYNRDNPQSRPYDGIIGYPFLSNFLTTIDYREKQLILKPY